LYTISTATVKLHRVVVSGGSESVVIS